MSKIWIFLFVGIITCFGSPAPRGPLDGVVNSLLDKLRPELAGLVLPDIDIVEDVPELKLNLTTSNITTQNLDSFTTIFLDTSLIPLRLKNLTLFWSEVSVNTTYDIEGILNVMDNPVELYGDGEATILLQNLTLEAIVTFSAMSGHLIVKDLEYLGANLASSNVTLTNFFGGGDLETIFNVFLSFFVPEFVNDQGDAVLEILKPNITEKLNEILAEIDFP